MLLPAETGFIEMDGNEKTYKLKQSVLLKEVDLNTAKNAMDLQLTKFGPYRLNYSRNGRFMLFAGQKGHVAVVDCQRTKVGLIYTSLGPYLISYRTIPLCCAPRWALFKPI